MSTSETRQKFTQEFKKEAVLLVVEQGRSVASVARDLGIHENQVFRWKRAYLNDHEDAFPGKGHLHPKDEEIRRLKRELEDVKEERDILKKAVAIFSKRPR